MPNKKALYQDMPEWGDIEAMHEVAADFLPKPEELAFKEERVKVTIELTKQGVDFFKREAKKHKSNYQTMIRHLMDRYVHNQA